MAAITIKDVAQKAGVSVASVSRALNGGMGVTDATRQRIKEVAARLRYIPHGAARSLITRRTNTIGALLPDLHGEFFSELIRGIDLAARARNLHLLVSSSHDSAADAAGALRAMQGRVDGMLILSGHVDEAFLHANLADHVPAVLINSPIQSDALTVLNVDNQGGAWAMVQHLLDAGHCSVTFIAGPRDNFDARERNQGYRDAMARLAPEALVHVIDGDFSEESGYRAGQQLLQLTPRPRAVFAANDMMAIGCLQAFKQAGIAVPSDIALAGFDDIPAARYVTPAMTTVRVSIADLGRIALERLAEKLEQPDPGSLAAGSPGFEIVVRETCGARRSTHQPGGAIHQIQPAARGGER